MIQMVIGKDEEAVRIYVDEEREEWSEGDGHSACGMKLVAECFAKDFALLGMKPGYVVGQKEQLCGNIIIAGTIGRNRVIDMLIAQSQLDIKKIACGKWRAWDSYILEFVSGNVLESVGISGVKNALIVAGSNKRGAMYGLFHISECMGVSPWVYMADATPCKKEQVVLDAQSLRFHSGQQFVSKEPSVKYRGFFINDESPSFTGWAKNAFGGLNEDCYCHIFELLLRLRANYLWPAMWDNVFSEEGKEYPLANAVLADAYGICMGTSHHEGCHRAGLEWQQKYKQYGTDNSWDYGKNQKEIYNFWRDGIERNGNYETTITLGMRGESDSRLEGGVQENIEILKKILSDQLEIIKEYEKRNPEAKTKNAPKIYIPYSENEEYYYGPDDGSVAGLNVWEGMKDVTIMLTDDNYGNLRSLPEKSLQSRAAGYGLYYHLDGHVGTGAYEWVSSTQLEHIWDHLTQAYDANVREIWVINVGDVKPLEMELSYALSLAYDMETWGQQNTAEGFRREWLQKQLGGEQNCSLEQAQSISEVVADFLKLSTYRKPEYVTSDMYSLEHEGEAEHVLDFCESIIKRAEVCGENFLHTPWEGAYEQIVYYQAVGTANVTKMQILKGYYDFFLKRDNKAANYYAGKVKKCIELDKELTRHYNNIMSDGKWKAMMSSPHVGFVSWNSEGWSYPEVIFSEEMADDIYIAEIPQKFKESVIVLDGCDFVASVPAPDGTMWCEIEGYGRYRSVMKMLPSINSFAIPTGQTQNRVYEGYQRKETVYQENREAPYLEYEFMIEREGEYLFTLYTTPTNNIFKPQGWGYVPVELCYGISVDNQRMEIVNSLPEGKYISYAADGDNRWIRGIKDNIHVSASKEWLSVGRHSVRIYGMHAGLGIERLVISLGELLSSYLGPQKR